MAPLSFALFGALRADPPRGGGQPTARHRRSVSIPERGGACSSRCRSRPPVPRFFAAAASAMVPDRAREQLVRPVGLFRSRRLVTLCVLRLGEPNPTARRLTSSVARRALPRGLLRAFAPRRPSFVRLRSGPVEPGPFETATRLEATARRTQDAFGEEDARSCDRPELCAFAVRLARFAPHPFARSGGDIPVTGMRPARATPRPLDSASRPRHRGREEDASSSTSAIDLRHEHP
jgi:hypothetical protein